MLSAIQPGKEVNKLGWKPSWEAGMVWVAVWKAADWWALGTSHVVDCPWQSKRKAHGEQAFSRGFCNLQFKSWDTGKALYNSGVPFTERRGLSFWMLTSLAFPTDTVHRLAKRTYNPLAKAHNLNAAPPSEACCLATGFLSRAELTQLSFTCEVKENLPAPLQAGPFHSVFTCQHAVFSQVVPQVCLGGGGWQWDTSDKKDSSPPSRSPHLEGSEEGKKIIVKSLS